MLGRKRMFRIHPCERKKLIGVLVLALFAGPWLHAAGAMQTEPPKSDQPRPGEPTDPKAKKTYASAVDWQKHGQKAAALDDFRKANKQDGGHCAECLRHAFGLAIALGAFKDAEEIAREWLPLAQTDEEKAVIHYHLAAALQWQGINNKKDKCLSESCDEFKAAFELEPRLTAARYGNGVSLAHLHQDDAARAEFAAFLDRDRSNPDMHERAERYVERIELARAKMAPPFSITTLDGQRISMDSLAGKVVLIDFWATWCGPCRQALPHISQIAHKFEGQPFVVLSISLDKDEARWKDFVEKNGMTWLQYRDGGFTGQISRQFNVNAIPATFTIDADGVLEDQHVGDANIEGKLKKLIARAAEMGNRKPAQTTADHAPGGAE
jgi:thiol-disulfide isomerase/thioredoxin